MSEQGEGGIPQGPERSVITPTQATDAYAGTAWRRGGKVVNMVYDTAIVAGGSALTTGIVAAGGEKWGAVLTGAITAGFMAKTVYDSLIR